MTYKQIIKHFGGVSKTARALRMTRAGVYRWREHGVPYRIQLLMEQVSKCSLKAKKK